MYRSISSCSITSTVDSQSVGRSGSVGDPVCDVATSGLRRAYNLHDLTFTHAKVPRHRILALNLRQLLRLGSVALQELLLLGFGEEHVLGHEFVLRDVDEQLVLNEELEVVWLVTFQ